MDMKPFLIRVDCNSKIASGHLMRCLAIADRAKKENIKCVFLMSDNNYEYYISGKGHSIVNLNTDWENLSLEIPKIKALIPQYENPILLIDTYSINSHYTSALYGLIPLIYLGSKTDNLGPLNVIINYSSNIDHVFYSDNFSSVQLLLGVKYAPLREEFQNIPLKDYSQMKNLLVTTGNTDNFHFISQFLQRAKNIFVENNITCHVIIGKLFDNIEELEGLAIVNPLIELHSEVHNMADIIRSCDLAVSANGTTIYELAACGVPTISFAISTEQVSSGESLHKKGIVDYCGILDGDTENCFKRIILSLNKFIYNNEIRAKLGKKAKAFIDGKGCEYIIKQLKKMN